MADQPITQKTRIPSMDFRGNKFVNQDGTLTESAQNFFDLLNTCLMKIMGSEGLVAPSQPTSNISSIQDNQQISQTNVVTYTCQFGTFIYDESANQVKVALNKGDGTPLFKQVLTA